MNDISKLLRDYLAANAGVSALTGGRIYAERSYPPRGVTPSAGNLLVFKARGGSVAYHSQQVMPSFQFKCYAGTELAANTLYRALFEALQDMHSGVFLHGECEVLGQTLEEPETEWVFVLTYFRFAVRR